MSSRWSLSTLCLDAFQKIGQMARNTRTSSGAVSLLLLVLPMLLASCQPHITDQGKRQLRNAAKLVEEESYVAAIDELSDFLETYSASDELCEAYYLLGLAHARLGQFDQARDDFESALDTVDVPIVEYYTRISLANLAFENQDYSRAVKFYDRYLDKMPRRAPFHLAYYRYGQALQARGKWKQADVQFSRILYLFPQAQIFSSAQQHFGQTHYAIELGRFPSFELAEQQRQEIPDLASGLPQARRTSDGWYYVNLYGEFGDLVQANKALEQIEPRLGQARIVLSR